MNKMNDLNPVQPAGAGPAGGLSLKEIGSKAFSSTAKAVMNKIPGSLSHTEGKVASNEQRALKTGSIAIIGGVFAASGVLTAGVIPAAVGMFGLGFVALKAYSHVQREQLAKKMNTPDPKSTKVSENMDELSKEIAAKDPTKVKEIILKFDKDISHENKMAIIQSDNKLEAQYNELKESVDKLRNGKETEIHGNEVDHAPKETEGSKACEATLTHMMNLYSGANAEGKTHLAPQMATYLTENLEKQYKNDLSNNPELKNKFTEFKGRVDKQVADDAKTANLEKEATQEEPEPSSKPETKKTFEGVSSPRDSVLQSQSRESESNIEQVKSRSPSSSASKGEPVSNEEKPKLRRNAISDMLRSPLRPRAESTKVEDKYNEFQIKNAKDSLVSLKEWIKNMNLGDKNFNKSRVVAGLNGASSNPIINEDKEMKKELDKLRKDFDEKAKLL